MLEQLPEYTDPRRVATTGQVLKGWVNLANMTRLAPLLHERKGNAEVQLTGGVDHWGIQFLTVSFQAEVVLICQRCLGPMIITVSGEAQLGIVGNERQARDLPDHYEPLVVADDPIATAALVEDEFILNLPVVPLHNASDCQVNTKDTLKPEPQPGNVTENPFASLASLKKKQ